MDQNKKVVILILAGIILVGAVFYLRNMGM